MEHKKLKFLGGFIAILASLITDGACLAQVRPAEKLPTVSVTLVKRTQIREKLLATGSFAAREEVLVLPEIEGLAVIEILAEAGDRVVAGQVLARLNRDTLNVQMAQNGAQLQRAMAAIDNAKAQISEAEANLEQSSGALERAKSLRASGAVTAEIYEQRLAAERVAGARLNAARQALGLAQADKALIEKQGAEVELKLSRCDIRAPTAGILSQRNVKIGQVATAIAGTEPLFRIIAGGNIDLLAEVPEPSFARLRVGQVGEVFALGRDEAMTGHVRLIAPEIDKTTRLGRVRIGVEGEAKVPLGAFGRANVLIDQRPALVVPLSAISFGEGQAAVQVVKDGMVETRRVEVGIRAEGEAEIRGGLSEGEEVVSVAGVFVRDGDQVRAVPLSPAK